MRVLCGGASATGMIEGREVTRVKIERDSAH